MLSDENGDRAQNDIIWNWSGESETAKTVSYEKIQLWENKAYLK